MTLKIIGTTSSRIRFLVAEDREVYEYDTPVAIIDAGVWHFHSQLSLGVAYKFNLWLDENDTKNEILETVTDDVLVHLKQRRLQLA